MSPSLRLGCQFVADDEGIMCIPQHLAEEVLDHAEEHERAEVIVKKMILDEGVAPGKYYNTETFERIERDGK